MPAKQTTVLVADDDPQLLRLMARNLELAGYTVIPTVDGADALQAAETTLLDLMILDVMMPRMDGFTVCQRVREFSNVPIIIVTARGKDQDKVRGLDLGADDYLTKPFSVEEFLARARAVLRRTQYGDEGARGGQSTFTLGNLTIDFAAYTVAVDGEEVALTPVEYKLLAYLAHNSGRVLTQDQLLEHVWGDAYLGESHLLQVSVNRLRRKIEPDPARPIYIQTRVGVGYMLPRPNVA